MQANFSSLLSLTPRSKAKQLYLTSITRNSNSTDKHNVDGALILLPLLHQCSVLRLLKLLSNGVRVSVRQDIKESGILGSSFSVIAVAATLS